MPMADNWVVVPGAMAGLAGEIAIDVRVGGGPPPTTPPPPPPEHAESIDANKKIAAAKLTLCFMALSSFMTMKADLKGIFH
jgi:hypothetical protein